MLTASDLNIQTVYGICICIRIAVADLFERHGIVLRLCGFDAFRQRLDLHDRFDAAEGIDHNHFLFTGICDFSKRHRQKWQGKEPKRLRIKSELSSFNFPDGTTTFISPQIGPETGWEQTKPSYEEGYPADAPMDTPSQYNHGYIFPALFHLTMGTDPAVSSKANYKGSVPSVRSDAWALVSETGVGSNYCGSHLSDYQPGVGYTIAYPDAGENNGYGTDFAAIPLPGETPWRTITLGTSLKPIVETTISYDLVEPLYAPSTDYKPGRYTWSWLIWQDKSINYDDQVKFIDLASDMGFEYCLVDNWWDTQIGRDRIEELSKYAQSKGVHLLLWYNSNGFWNDAPQGPRDCMSTAIAREREMRWMQSIGIKGIKVDFFGGDKQETMRLYEDHSVNTDSC